MNDDARKRAAWRLYAALPPDVVEELNEATRHAVEVTCEECGVEPSEDIEAMALEGILTHVVDNTRARLMEITQEWERFFRGEATRLLALSGGEALPMKDLAAAAEDRVREEYGYLFPRRSLG